MKLAKGSDGRGQEWHCPGVDGPQAHHPARVVLIVGGSAQPVYGFDGIDDVGEQLAPLV